MQGKQCPVNIGTLRMGNVWAVTFTDSYDAHNLAHKVKLSKEILR